MLSRQTWRSQLVHDRCRRRQALPVRWRHQCRADWDPLGTWVSTWWRLCPLQSGRRLASVCRRASASQCRPVLPTTTARGLGSAIPTHRVDTVPALGRICSSASSWTWNASSSRRPPPSTLRGKLLSVAFRGDDVPQTLLVRLSILSAHQLSRRLHWRSSVWFCSRAAVWTSELSYREPSCEVCTCSLGTAAGAADVICLPHRCTGASLRHLAPVYTTQSAQHACRLFISLAWSHQHIYCMSENCATLTSAICPVSVYRF